MRGQTQYSGRLGRRPARINVSLLVGLVLGAGLLVGGALFVKKWRSTRMSEKALATAEAAAARGDWEVASKQYREYVETHPTDAQALTKWGDACLRVRPREARHVQRAMQAYREVLRIQPGDERLLDQLIRLNARVFNSPDQMAYWARQWIQSHPDNVRPKLWLGRALTSLKEFDESRRTLREVFNDPNRSCPDAAILLALLELDAQPAAAGRDAAKEALDDGVKRFPDSARMLAYRGRFMLRSLRDADAARADLQRAIALGTNDPLLHMRLFDELTELGDLDAAEKELLAARDADPSARAQSVAAEIVADIGEEPESWDVFQFKAQARLIRLKVQAGKETPAGAAAFAASQEAALRSLEGRERDYLPALTELYAVGENAAKTLECANAYRAALDPAAPGAESHRVTAVWLDALAAVAQHDDRSAYRIVALPDHPDQNPRLLLLKASAYQKLDQPARALPVLQRYLAAAANDVDAQAMYGRILTDLGRWAEARRVVRQMIDRDPQRADARLLSVELDLSEWPDDPAAVPAEAAAKARSDLNELRKALPDNGQVLFLQAGLEEKAGNVAAAEGVLRPIIAQSGADHDRALNALLGLLLRHQRGDDAVALAREQAEKSLGKARPWLIVADVCERMKKLDDARAALDRAEKEAGGDLDAKTDAMMSRGMFALRHDADGAGEAVLEALRKVDAGDLRCRVVLLERMFTRAEDKPDSFDEHAAQALVDEVRDIETEADGVRWRTYQARVWMLTGAKGRDAQIESLLRDALARDPSYSAATLTLGAWYESRGNATAAEDIYRKALAASPRALNEAQRLLDLLKSQQRYQDAEAVANMLAAAGRNVITDRVWLALRSERTGDAIDLLREQVAVNARDAGARVLLAELLFKDGKRYNEVAPLLDEAERIAPAYSDAAFVRCRMLEAEQRFDDAETVCRQRVERADDYASHLLRGQFYFRRGRFDDAEVDFKRLPSYADSAVEGWFVLARFYAESGKFERSIKTFEEGLAAFPNSLTLRQGIAEVLMGKPDAASRQRGMALVADLYKEKPDDPLTQLMQAAILLEQKTPAAQAQAEQLLSAALTRRPNLLQAHLLLIQIARERGDGDKAISLCRQALQAQPGNAELLLVQADIERAAGNLSRARQIAQDVARRFPGKVMAKLFLADLSAAEGRYDGPDAALSWARSAVEVEPDNTQARVKLALLLQAAGRVDDATSDLDAFIAAHGDEVVGIQPLTVLADLYRIAGQPDKARSTLDRARKLDPRSSDVLIVEGRWLAAGKAYGDLDQLLRRNLAENTGAVDFLVDGATQLAATRDPKWLGSALDTFSRIVRQAPNNVDAQIGLATTSYLLGDRKTASAAYEAVIVMPSARRDQLVQALNGAAWILFEDNRDLPRAMDLSNRAATLAPNHPEVLDTCACIAERMGNLAAARRDFERIINLPDTARDKLTLAKAVINAARVCLAAGDRDAAKSYVSRAESLGKEGVVLDDATIRELAELSKQLQ